MGDTRVVEQGNCSGGGHSGFWRYSYDFTMTVGTPVSASRAGRVLVAEDSAPDGLQTRTNLIVIEHADGTVMLYSHLTRSRALVEVGESVAEEIRSR